MKSSFTPVDIKNLLVTLPDFSKCEVEYVSEGVSTEVYRLTCGNNTFYFRLSDECENKSTEVLAHKLIIEKGVRAPKVLYYEDYNEQLNRSFMITGAIPGSAIKKDKAVPEEVIIEAGRQLALINSIPVKGFGWLDWEEKNIKELKGQYSTYEEFVLDFKEIRSRLEVLISNEVMDNKQADKYLKYVKNRQGLVEVKQAILSHGDFDDSHIYALDGKYSGIIDFGDIRATSIYHDLAHYYTYSPRNFKFLLKGYQEVGDLGSNYMEKIEFVAMLFVIGKLWWVTKNMPETLGGRQNDHELLTRVLEMGS